MPQACGRPSIATADVGPQCGPQSHYRVPVTC
jgi:hypothetical protein